MFFQPVSVICWEALIRIAKIKGRHSKNLEGARSYWLFSQPKLKEKLEERGIQFSSSRPT